jgi:hypothetical protein
MRNGRHANKGTFQSQPLSHMAHLMHKKMPAMEIAGLCLPLKPQKERRLKQYIAYG